MNIFYKVTGISKVSEAAEEYSKAQFEMNILLRKQDAVFTNIEKIEIKNEKIQEDFAQLKKKVQRNEPSRKVTKKQSDEIDKEIDRVSSSVKDLNVEIFEAEDYRNQLNRVEAEIVDAEKKLGKSILKFRIFWLVVAYILPIILLSSSQSESDRSVSPNFYIVIAQVLPVLAIAKYFENKKPYPHRTNWIRLGENFDGVIYTAVGLMSSLTAIAFSISNPVLFYLVFLSMTSLLLSMLLDIVSQ